MANQRDTSPLFVLVAMIAVVAALYLAKEILLPLSLAILLSFLLTPLCNRLERWGLPRIPTVILVVALSFAPLGVLGWIVTDQLVDLGHTLPQYRESIKRNIVAKVRAIIPDSDTVGPVRETIEDLSEELTNGASAGTRRLANKNSGSTSAADGSDLAQSEQPADGETAKPTGRDMPATSAEANKAVPVTLVEIYSPLTQMQNWLGKLAAPLTTAGMVVVLVFFLLMDRESQRNRLIQLFGKSNLHITTEAFHDAAQRVGRYLRMLFVINMGYGIAVALGLWLIGVPSALMWGFLGFVLRFLPYLGPWLAAAMPILVTIAVFEGWTQPLLVIGMYVVYELVLNNVAEPLLYSGSIGVSTVAVILAAIFWTWIWGPIGLVLAMPLTVCLVVMSRYVSQLRFINVLLADQPPLTPSERIYQRLLAFDYDEPRKFALKHLETMPLARFYDEVLIPAIVLGERDRHTGVLNTDQEEFLQESSADLVDELGDQVAARETVATAGTESSSAGAAVTSDLGDARILCVPLRDQADEIASRMLAQLLVAEGFQVDTDAPEALTSEVVDHVAKLAIDVVVISILPPIAPRDTRLLWKRLRGKYPDLPIIVGFWSGAAVNEPMQPPGNDAATRVATTLIDAVALVRSMSAQRKLAEFDSSRDTAISAS